MLKKNLYKEYNNGNGKTITELASEYGLRPSVVSSLIKKEGGRVLSYQETMIRRYGKPVVATCTTTGKSKEFPSTKSATNYVVKNINNKAQERNISRVCKGKRKTAYGFYWEYA